MARAPVSKTAGREFESLSPCHIRKPWDGNVPGLFRFWRPVVPPGNQTPASLDRFGGLPYSINSSQDEVGYAALAATGRLFRRMMAEGRGRRSPWRTSFSAYSGALMAKSNPFEFLQQVRSEASKVTWPTRKETLVTTAMVFVMVAVASVFFLVADQLIRIAVTFVLGIGT